MAHFLIGLFVYLLSFKSSFYILDNTPLSSPNLNITYFILLTSSFTEQNISLLIKSNLSILSVMDCAFGVVPKKSSPYPRSPGFSPIFWEFYSFAFYIKVCNLFQINFLKVVTSVHRFLFFACSV